MVEERITDPKGIAELLASEITGLALGPLEDASVVDADRTVEPGPDRPRAYGIAVAGTQVGSVELDEGAAVLLLERVEDPERIRSLVADRSDVAVDVSAADGVRITLRTGASVKPAVDVIRAALGDGQDPG